jgi:type IV pilus assembly protein PilE
MPSAEVAMAQYRSRRADTGFTLIEVMCVVAMAGVLSSIAYPSYQSAVHRTRRSDAQVALLSVQMAQERYRADHPSYGGLADVGFAATSPGGYYTLTVPVATGSGFEAQASAMGTQTTDTACRVMKLVVDGANVAYASGTDSTVANDSAANKKCWGQ